MFRNFFIYTALKLALGPTILCSVLSGQKAILEDVKLEKNPDGPRVNGRIRSEWGPSVQNWKMRIVPGTKTLWGSTESPTFLLELENESDAKRQIELNANDLSLTINGKKYRWDSPGTRWVSTLAGKEVRKNFFIVQLNSAQWKPVEELGERIDGRLAGMEIGKKELVVQLKIRANGDDTGILKSGTIKFEITESAFEMPSVTGVLLAANGKPLADADIYLCRNSQFSIYYSNFNGKWFTSKRVSHFDPFGGRFSSTVKPFKTGKQGEFSLSPTSRDKRIVVLPPVGSAQVFDLPSYFADWNIQLRETGSLVLEHDIDGEKGTTNASVTSSRILAEVPGKPTSAYRITESFSIPLNNGTKYDFKNMAPNVFKLNRYKYVRIGNRSYSIGRFNHEFNIKSGVESSLRMVRKTGQKVAFSINRVPENSQYLMVGIFELDQEINLQRVYSNHTVWADAASSDGEKPDFKSCLISPGKYRLVVMSVPQGKVPTQYVYKPDFVGSRLIDVSKAGELDAGEVRLFPVERWIQNSGMALKLKLVNAAGTDEQGQVVWPINRGYQQGFDGLTVTTNSQGMVQTVKPPGKYLLACGLDKNQAVLFQVQVPRMTAQRVVLPEPVAWSVPKEGEKSIAQIEAEFKKESRELVIRLRNGSNQPVRPQFGDVQLMMQLAPTNFSTGVRFLPPPESVIYQKNIAPNSDREYKLEYSRVLSEWMCTSTPLSLLKIQNQQQRVANDFVWASAKFGTTYSALFQVPMLPKLPTKPFR